MTDFDVEQFLERGFVRVEEAVARPVAAACCELLWQEMGLSPSDRSTWTRPVVRTPPRFDPPFREAVKGPRLAAAIDRLVGPGRWSPFIGLGASIVVRFPAGGEPGDTGWHVDASFAPDEVPSATPTGTSAGAPAAGAYLEHRVNVASRGRALLALFLLSDVSEDDAPTRIRVGSHLDVARILAPHGERGLSASELGARIDASADIAARPLLTATGPAGTVYLCHPFLAHAAQPHRGQRARFLGQPPIVPTDPVRLDRPAAERSAVERAIHRALEGAHG